MRVEHLHPVAATVSAHGRTDRKVCHLTIGPGADADAAEPGQVTILWAWSAHLGRPFPWYITTAEPVALEGRPSQWTLDIAPGITAKLRRQPGAWCCGDPMKRWRPPGFERPKAGTV